MGEVVGEGGVEAVGEGGGEAVGGRVECGGGGGGPGGWRGGGGARRGGMVEVGSGWRRGPCRLIIIQYIITFLTQKNSHCIILLMNSVN